MKNAKTFPVGPYPVIPMRNMVLFPEQTMPVVIGRPRSRLALEAALASGTEWVVLVAQKQDVIDHEPTIGELYYVGVLARIDRFERTDDRAYQVVLTGQHRFKIDEFENFAGYLRAHGENLDDVPDGDLETTTSLSENMRTLAGEIFELLPGNTERLAKSLRRTHSAADLTHLVAQHLELKVARKQEVLETRSLKARLLMLLEQMVQVREELRLQREVNQKLSSRLGKQHRDAILREQIRTLQEELGETAAGDELTLAQKLRDAKLPEDVLKMALDQAQRLEGMGNQAPESHVIRSYLDLLIALPWSQSSAGAIDLERARRILNEDHYGLDKIKKRILQHLAVLKLREKKGSILLFVGPPGVGKTSLGRSIARAMGRKFVRVSLGGVRDDAEIRGHRRTYVGALPGRIIDGIKRAGENNPVFMLDEIDKMTRGWGGDPAASMLEVLDPEQNAKFLDHYVDVPFDLSNVFFIATANTTESIPAPLLDRMEVIQLSGYTTAEKLHISSTHLVPKQLEEHGVNAAQLEISEAAQLGMIDGYTREAGVRELQRLVGTTVRASTERVLASDGREPIRVDLADLEEMLGPERFTQELAGEINPPGVVTGLAWTPVGGDILFIESSRMPGRGKMIITGQLGEVMRESAQIAMTLVRSRLASSAQDFSYEREDLHIHVPAGAIPKDGPSAGVAMLSAMASLVLHQPVDPRIAMTGEITLRGAVMPVGGIKEKVIAAHRAGIRKVLLPKRNERDLKEVPDEVRRGLEFVFAETIEEALFHVLGIEPARWALAAPRLVEAPAPRLPAQ